MKKIAMILAIAVAGLLAGCVVVPAGSRPVPVVGPTVIVIDDSGAPPPEFIIGNRPLYYGGEPGVPYYEVFFGFPGSCFCILPVRFVGGVWYVPGRIEVHRGHLPFHRPGPQHLNAWNQSRGVFRGHAPVYGQMERGPSGRLRPLPPPGVHHHQPRGPVPHVGPQHAVPHVAPPQRPAQPHVQPRTEQRQSAPRAAPPQPQARPQPQQQQRAPAKAPPKQCATEKKC